MVEVVEGTTELRGEVGTVEVGTVEVGTVVGAVVGTVEAGGAVVVVRNGGMQSTHDGGTGGTAVLDVGVLDVGVLDDEVDGAVVDDEVDGAVVDDEVKGAVVDDDGVVLEEETVEGVVELEVLRGRVVDVVLDGSVVVGDPVVEGAVDDVVLEDGVLGRHEEPTGPSSPHTNEPLRLLFTAVSLAGATPLKFWTTSSCQQAGGTAWAPTGRAALAMPDENSTGGAER